MSDENSKYDDRPVNAYNGFMVLAGFVAVASVGLFSFGFNEFTMVVAIIAAIIMFSGFIVLSPNEGKAFTFFGKYSGVWKDEGFYWINIFYMGRKTETKLINFDTKMLKVNDVNGNPVEVTAIIGYHISGIAKSFFGPEEVHSYVHNQAEAALRNLVAKYPYSTPKVKEGEAKGDSLLGSKEKVSEELQRGLQGLLSKVGVTIDEAHLNHLAYAPEIASEMLRVQQAGAVLEAKEVMVQGAVQIAKRTIEELEKQSEEDGEKETKVELSAADKSKLVVNLLTVLASDSGASAVLPLSSGGNL